MYICLVLLLCVLHTSSQRDVVANVQSRYKTKTLQNNSTNIRLRHKPNKNRVDYIRMNYNFSCPSYGPLHQALSGKTRKGNISVNNKLQRKATVKMNFNWGQNGFFYMKSLNITNA